MDIGKEDLKTIVPGMEKGSWGASSCGDDLGMWNDTVWRGRQQQWGLEDCCAVHFKQQSLKSARAISSQYFTCKGERTKRRRSPMLLLRQGRRQTGPPSSECEFQGPDARDVFLCSPVGGSLWIQKSLCLKQQILAHLLQTQPGKRERVMSKLSPSGAERTCLLMCLRKIPQLSFSVYLT